MWLKVLRERVETEGRAAVLSTLGVSSSLLSQVLNEKYPGDLERIRQLVEGAYMSRTVSCPILGELPLNQCLAHQANKKTTGNPFRLRLYKACRSGCPHSKLAPTLSAKSAAVTKTVGVKAFDAHGVIRRVERQAASDGSSKYELLKDQFFALAAKYNKLRIDDE